MTPFSTSDKDTDQNIAESDHQKKILQEKTSTFQVGQIISIPLQNFVINIQMTTFSCDHVQNYHRPVHVHNIGNLMQLNHPYVTSNANQVGYELTLAC